MARLKFAALAAAAAIAVAACGGSATQSPAASQPAASQPAPSQPAASETPAANAPKEGGTLVVALSGDINRTDPSLVDDANSTYVESQVLETLVTLKPGTGDEIIPALATEWSVSDDGLSYTFKIRDGVKFHDGTALDAAAVKANFDRWMTIPKSYVDLGYTYYIDTVVTGKITKVEAPDASTVVVTLNAPNSAFLVAMTVTPFGISSPKALVDGNASAPDFKDNKYATGGPPAMVGTGPFMFKEWVPGDHVTLVKNPDYWNKAAGGPYLDQITFKPIADTTATLNAIQSGDVDLAMQMSPVDVPTVKADTNLQLIDRGSACNVGVLGMNQTHKPFDNPKIRQAMAYAIDRPALAQAFFGGAFGLVPSNWAPPGTPFVNELALPTYDPDKARALIAESGVTDLSFDFWYPSDVTPGLHARPEGRVRGDPEQPRGGRLQAEPEDRPLAARLPRRGVLGQVPGVAHRLELRLARHRQLPVHRVLRLPGRPDRAEPGVRLQERRDEPGHGRRPDGDRRGRSEGRLGQGPGADPGRHARRAARVEQDARGPAGICEGLRPGPDPARVPFERLARQVAP